jgi:hypothetical protein
VPINNDIYEKLPELKSIKRYNYRYEKNKNKKFMINSIVLSDHISKGKIWPCVIFARCFDMLRISLKGSSNSFYGFWINCRKVNKLKYPLDCSFDNKIVAFYNESLALVNSVVLSSYGYRLLVHSNNNLDLEGVINLHFLEKQNVFFV